MFFNSHLEKEIFKARENMHATEADIEKDLQRIAYFKYPITLMSKIQLESNIFYFFDG